jgi:hypothetical protein
VVWSREAAAAALPGPVLSESGSAGLARSGAVAIGHHGSGGAAEGGGGRTGQICSGRQESAWPRGDGGGNGVGTGVAMARRRGGDGEATGTAAGMGNRE